jgi:hypothetical protein
MQTPLDSFETTGLDGLYICLVYKLIREEADIIVIAITSLIALTRLKTIKRNYVLLSKSSCLRLIVA